MFLLNCSLIRELFFKRGLTIRGFARRAGINVVTASKVIKDGAKVNGRIVSTLAKFFGVEGDALLKKEAD